MVRDSLPLRPIENLRLPTIVDEIKDIPQVDRIKDVMEIESFDEFYSEIGNKNEYVGFLEQIKKEPMVITPKICNRKVNNIHCMRKSADLDDNDTWKSVPVKRHAFRTWKCPKLTFSDVPGCYE